MTSSHEDDEAVLAALLDARAGDAAVRARAEDRAVHHFRPYALSLARRYAHRGVEDDDLAQVALLGLLRAVRGYDPTCGRFQGYAAATVLGEVKRHFRDHVWVVRPPRRVQELRARVLRVGGTVDDVARVSDELGERRADVLEAIEAGSLFRLLSLDRPSLVTGRPLVDEVVDPRTVPDGDADRCADVRDVCARLGDADRRLLRERFVEGRTQGDIARSAGVSQAQVSRRLAALLHRIGKQVDDRRAGEDVA